MSRNMKHLFMYTVRLYISGIKVQSLFLAGFRLSVFEINMCCHFNYPSNVSDQVNSSPGTLTKARSRKGGSVTPCICWENNPNKL